MPKVPPDEPLQAVDEPLPETEDPPAISEQPAAKRRKGDEDVDEMLDETFPASDPPSYWAGR